jgi:hypothetical protein
MCYRVGQSREQSRAARGLRTTAAEPAPDAPFAASVVHVLHRGEVQR